MVDISLQLVLLIKSMVLVLHDVIDVFRLMSDSWLFCFRNCSGFVFDKRRTSFIKKSPLAKYSGDW